MASNKTSKARQAVQQLLEALDITQVVFVDDVFVLRDRVDVEQAIGYFTAVLHKNPAAAISVIEVPQPLSQEDDAWILEFRDKWARLKEAEQQEKIKQLALLSEVHPQADFEVKDRLNTLFPENIQKHFLYPSAWENAKNTILEHLSPQSRLLCFVDQDLSGEQGFSSQGSFSGGGLLTAMLGAGYGDLVYCGILSHTIPQIADERTYRLTFASKYGLEGLHPQQFLPLAKLRLQDDSLMQVADGIKKVVLNAYSENLKFIAKDILNEAHQRAIERLDDLDVYSFDRMILRHYKGGEWEADTIVRIFQIFQRDAMRELLLDVTTSTGFNQSVLAARPISAIETLDEEDIYPRIRNIRRLELYEKSELVKHTPLQVGDIFARSMADGSRRIFILLAQPCDLAVRPNGTRSGRLVPLVPICITENSYNNKKTRRKWNDFWSTRAIIDNYSEKPGDLAILEFKDAEWISIDVLDLCVVNSEGQCRINLNNANNIPHQLTVGWRELLRMLIERFSKYHEHLDAHKKQDAVASELWKLLIPKFCFTDFLPQMCYEDGVFDFGLQRLERYRPPGADFLLKLFTQFLSRDARDFDFSER